MPQYTLDQKLEAFRRLMKDEVFRDYNNSLNNAETNQWEKGVAEKIQREKEKYIIETYPELFG